MEGFTLQEIAKFLGISRVRVWQMIREKKLKGVRAGRMWFVLPEDLRLYTDTKARAKVKK